MIEAEIKRLRRTEELAISVKVWYQMLENGEMSEVVFANLIGEKLDQLEEKGGF
jgi:hypothetical protein